VRLLTQREGTPAESTCRPGQQRPGRWVPAAEPGRAQSGGGWRRHRV